MKKKLYELKPGTRVKIGGTWMWFLKCDGAYGAVSEYREPNDWEHQVAFIGCATEVEVDE